MQKRRRKNSPPLTPERVFARVLRELRQTKGISQEELGFESGYHPTYISLLERGRRNPTLRAILAIATVLDVPASQIVARVESLYRIRQESSKTPVRSARET